MQVAAVLMLDARTPLPLEEVRRAIAARITAVPRLRQTLASTPFGGGRPVWIDDPTFDITRHVTELDTAEAVDEAAVLIHAARVVEQPLPRHRPLWSATLIAGRPPGPTSLIVVFHHALADGIGGLAILGRLVDDASTAPAPPPPFPRTAPSHRALRIDALQARLTAVHDLPARLRRVRAAVAELHLHGAGHTAAARSSLNRPIGRARALFTADADLAAIRAVAHDHGATVNDAVLTAVTGALRSTLAGRGETIDRFTLSIPISARRTTDAAHLGNHVGVLPVTVPAQGDTVGRLSATAGITRQRKTTAPGSSAAIIDPIFRGLARIGLFDRFISRQRLVHTFVTNLIGPDHEQAFLGRPVTKVIAVPMISGNITVAFAALSYAGRLTVTVVSDPDTCADGAFLARAVQSELDILTAPAPPRSAGAPHAGATVAADRAAPARPGDRPHPAKANAPHRGGRRGPRESPSIKETAMTSQPPPLTASSSIGTRLQHPERRATDPRTSRTRRIR